MSVLTSPVIGLSSPIWSPVYSTPGHVASPVASSILFPNGSINPLTSTLPVVTNIPFVSGYTITGDSYYINSLISVPLDSSLNLNKDENTRNQITKYFYHKTLDKWLLNDLKVILEYLKVDGNTVKVLKEPTDKNTNTDAVKQKIKYIEDRLLSKKMVKKILKSYTEKTGVNWYDIYKNTGPVKDLIKNMILAQIKGA